MNLVKWIVVDWIINNEFVFYFFLSCMYIYVVYFFVVNYYKECWGISGFLKGELIFFLVKCVVFVIVWLKYN